MSECCVLLDPGHGASNFFPKGKFRRPLMTLGLGSQKAEIVCGPRRNLYDKVLGYYREDLGTLKIAAATQKYLEEAGFKVYLTRDLDDDVNAPLSLRKRLRIPKYKRILWSNSRWIKNYAKTVKSNIFVAIHTNAGGGTGFSSFYHTRRGEELGKYMLQELNESLGLPIRRNSKHSYSVIKNNSGNNSCLIECGFHDNPKDLKILLSDEGINTIGESLSKGINFFAQVHELI
jgi:N-acetylmuramoyl-L-alanine amidase